MNLAEKILGSHSGSERVRPGELINVRVDLVYSIDAHAPFVIDKFKKLGVSAVFDPRKIVFLPMCLAPAKTVPSADVLRMIRDFAAEYGITYYEYGRGGIMESVLPDDGWLSPGDVFVGADSHTCSVGAIGAFGTGMGSTDIAVAMATGEAWMKVPSSLKVVFQGRPKKWVGAKDLILHVIGDLGDDGANYRAMEFHGEAVGAMSIDERFTIANMSMEAGAKTSLFETDEKTLAYLEPRATRPAEVLLADSDAEYERVLEYDVSTLEPLVAFPPLPSNVRPVSHAGGLEISQVKIGMCTNGRLDSLGVAAEILRGRKVHPRVQCLIIPASQRIYLEALERGYVKTFIEAGASVEAPGCAPCVGGLGVLAAGERCVSTTNRNFVGRMGHPESEIYLSGPAVAASSAVLGRIASPEEVM